MAINSLKEAGGYEPNIPQACSGTTMTLQPMTGSVYTDRVARAYRIPLTDSCPNQECYWGIPDLNGGQSRYDAGSGGYPRVKIVRILSMVSRCSPRKVRRPTH